MLRTRPVRPLPSAKGRMASNFQLVGRGGAGKWLLLGGYSVGQAGDGVGQGAIGLFDRSANTLCRGRQQINRICSRSIEMTTYIEFMSSIFSF